MSQDAAVPPPRPAISDNTPPPRPAMSDHTPPPITPEPERTAPAAVRTSRAMWILSIAAGVVVLSFALFDREDARTRLIERLTEMSPERTAEDLEWLATIVMWGTAGLLLLVVLIEAALLRRLVRRRTLARTLQLVVLVVHAVVALLVDAFLVPPADEGLPLRAGLAGHYLLACAAFVVSLLPPTGAWLRGR